DGRPKVFTRLRDGDHVSKGDLLLRLHDDLARADVNIQKAKLQATEADLRAAEATSAEAKVRFDRVSELRRRAPGTVSEDEVAAARLTYVRYMEEVKSKMAAVIVAQKELELSTVKLEMCQVRAPVTGKIRAVLKNTGEGVRQLEPVLHIQP